MGIRGISRTVPVLVVGFVCCLFLLVGAPGPATSGSNEPLRLRQSMPPTATLQNASGIALAADGQSYWVVHNSDHYRDQSTSTASVLLIGRDGSVRFRVDLPNVTFTDVQDIAVGPGPGGASLYVADTGNRVGGGPDWNRREFSIYRIVAPSVSAAARGGRITASADRLRFRFPDTGRHHCEALLVDPADGSLLVVESAAPAGRAPVWRLPNTWGDSRSGLVTQAGAISLSGIRAATIDPNRTMLVLLGTDRVIGMPIGPDQPLTEALVRAPTTFRLARSGGGGGMTMNPTTLELIINPIDGGLVTAPLPGDFAALVERVSQSPEPQRKPLVGMAVRLSAALSILCLGLCAGLVIRRRRRQDTASGPPWTPPTSRVS